MSLSSPATTTKRRNTSWIPIDEAHHGEQEPPKQIPIPMSGFEQSKVSVKIMETVQAHESTLTLFCNFLPSPITVFL